MPDFVSLPDPAFTVWVGHVKYPTPNNPWNIGVGTGMVPVPPLTGDSSAVWDWDSYVVSGSDAENDSLMGWWPIRRAYDITGGMVIADNLRPWWALDYGNQANYVINEGVPRTFGVVGVWHRDGGANQGTRVPWAPLGGNASAWCGLRAHGDNSAVDAAALGGTGNPLNQDVMQFNGVNSFLPGGTGKNFPGYAGQWDQMLYRDVQLNDGELLDLGFLYRTRMSTAWEQTPAVETGWFENDPLTMAVGNYVPAGAAVIDRFTVCIGAPVNDDACIYSDSSIRPVYDRQRRWFSEVLRVNEPAVPWMTLLTVTGDSPLMAFGQLVNVQPILDAQPGPGGIVRIVFRVKTNRGFDDGDGSENGYSSGGFGAVVLDNVVVNQQVIGDFESVSSIDNRVEVPPTQAWKSTGKPPAVFFHVRNLAELMYNDLCGPDRYRQCVYGNVISAGDYDNAERAGGPYGSPEQEREDGIISPTIDLTPGTGPQGANRMGITPAIADATDDYYIRYDIYTGVFNLMFQGNAWTFGFQSYPAQQANDVACWGELRVPDFQLFWPEPLCLTDLEPAYRYNLIRTSNQSGIPDSLRIFLGKSQQCFRFAVSTGCSPTDGCYFDNVSLAFVDRPPQGPTGPGLVAVDPWHWVNDAFPSSDDDDLPGTAAFDRTTALIRTGLNIGTVRTNDGKRNNIGGDSTVVMADGTRVRVDLVFRIKPGPGNYVVVGNKSSRVARFPGGAVAVPGDGSFWGQYLADNGPFGTAGGHVGGVWSENVWNSARCDTAETNLFPVTSRGNLPGIRPGVWASMYHESDPQFANLGIVKNRCFLWNPAGPVDETNITCNAVPWWANIAAGYDGDPTTREYTKILPDAQFTPGTHVQYFFRKSDPLEPAVFSAVPDTNYILPQAWEVSSDGQRWQQFGVLPDRWKDPAFGGDGLGMACALYVDLADRRGDERIWVSVADSIGATLQAKWGAHNGWHAGDNYVYDGVNVGLDDAICVRAHGGQPGSTWDMYGVKASESLTTRAAAFGSRLAIAAQGQAAGKDSKSGPTLKMLTTYYRMLMMLTGGLSSGILGPYLDYTPDDVALLQGFLGSGTQQDPKALFTEGNGFAQSEDWTGGLDPAHSQFLADYLGLMLRDQNYRALSGNEKGVVDLTPRAPITSNGDIYGVRNDCQWTNDVFRVNAVTPEAAPASYYENYGAQGPYVAGVFKDSNAERPWVTLTDGWDIVNLGGRYDVSTNGRLAYMYNVLTNVFGSICAVAGTPAITLDTPQNPRGTPFVDFMRLESENPVRGRTVRLAFGLARSGRVEAAVYDLAGRRVKLLASRVFPAGEAHVLSWDGTDDAGHRLARGVYFWQVRSPGFTSTRRVVFLR